MKRILFVDDEPNVLDGLRRMLRGMRQQWEMEFAESGPQALRRLAEAHFDVVVTDMRMPGMDGSALLGEVLQQFPSTVRIVLSGQCGRESVLQAVGPTHQFLTKPCDAETLRETVARVCRARDQLCDEHYRQVVSHIRCLGSRPSIHAELTAELDAATPSLDRIGEIVTQDLGASLKVLQMVNSGFFGTPSPITCPARAVTLLGLDILRALVVSVEAIAPLQPEDQCTGAVEAVLDHSLAVARAARAIAWAETGDKRLADDAYLGGLLHDVGFVVLAQEMPKRFADLLYGAREDGASLWETEKRYFSVTHAELGAYLAALWGLPDVAIEIMALHHLPDLSADAEFSALTAVHAACSLLSEGKTGIEASECSVNMDYLCRIGCDGRLDAWREACPAAVLEGVTR